MAKAQFTAQEGDRVERIADGVQGRVNQTGIGDGTNLAVFFDNGENVVVSPDDVILLTDHENDTTEG